MNIELNLVSTKDTFSSIFTLLERKRVQDVNTQEEVMTSIVNFIVDNISTIDAILPDKSLINKLTVGTKLTISDFLTLKYILSMSGLDILIHGVAGNEKNELTIPNGEYEVVIVDNAFVQLSFIPMSNKVSQVSTETNISEVYQSILDNYYLFNPELFEGSGNQPKLMIESIKGNEKITGRISSNISTYLSSIFSYLGKELVIILPAE